MTKLALLSAMSAAALIAAGSQAWAQDQPQDKPTVPATPPVASTPPGAPVPPTDAAPTPAPQVPATKAAPAPTAPAAIPPVVAKGDIVDTLRASGQFTILVKALDATNLTAVLKGRQGLTLFAPTDAAFAALPKAQLDGLMADPARLQGLLAGHLVNSSLDSSKVEGTTGDVQTVGGTTLMLDDRGDALMAGAATVVQADIHATNGIVHVIDKVLVPGAEKTVAAAPAEQPAEEPAAMP
ncbi:MAG: fasciclin domain-containing protein [Caulobacter sp.]|nr:fasciclin domain-containing protein [Caulobacter sp.]